MPVAFMRFLRNWLCIFMSFAAGCFCAMGGVAFAALSIPLSVNMSEVVTVTGSPRISVNVGGVTRYAPYTSGSGTSVLVFTLVPQAGDLDLDGVTLASPIDLNGGAIKDLSGNDLATLAFTVPNTSSIKVNSPSLGMDFVYDSDGRYTLGNTAYNDLSSFLSAAGGSFSRASVATYTDVSGLVQTATSGAPRFEYAPVAHTPKGILIEEARTNNFIRTTEFDNATWTKLNTTVSANTQTAPDGTLSAEKLIPSAAYDWHVVSQSYAFGSDTYAASAFFKDGGYRYGVVNFTSKAVGIFDLQAGTVVYSSVGSVASVIPYGNGWYRCLLTVTTTGTTPTVEYAGTPNTSWVQFSGDGTSGVYVWGAQVERGSFPTSYIPTTTITITRAADVLSIPTGSWYQAASSTFMAETYVETNSYQAFRGRWVGANSGVVLGSAGALFNVETWTGSAPPVNVTFSPAASTSVYVAGAVAWDTTTGIRGLVARGGAVSTSVIPGVYGFSTIYVGSGGGNGFINAPVRRIKYYPTRVSDTQLQLVTQ